MRTISTTVRERLRKIRGLILDMDGVLWRGEQPIGDLQLIFAKINERGYRTVLATNNATRSVEQYIQKLENYCVHLEDWQIVTSAIATGHYLSQSFPDGGNIFLVGEKALEETMRQLGFVHTSDGKDVLAVVAALDRGISYAKLRQATLLIRSGAAFIATNPDRTFPEPEGLVPGAGAILAFIEAATETKPIVIGKPSPRMYRVALDRMQTSLEETLIVGDRLETDIAGGQSLGCPTALVLTGVTTIDKALEWQPAPTLITENLSSLLEML